MNPIKSLTKIIKTSRLEMRTLDANLENATLIYNALQGENPVDFYFNPIATPNNLPESPEKMLIQMEYEAKACAENGLNLYIFLDDRLIGYRRIYFHDDATKTLQSSTIWLVKSAWGKGYACETFATIEELAFN